MKYTMMARFKIIFLMLSLCHTTLPLTLVYSMKIRRVFAGAHQVLKKEGKVIWLLSILPIMQHRKAHIVTASPAVNVQQKRLVSGGLFNLRSMPTDSSWFEFTTAFQNEHGTTRGSVNTKGSRTGFDDIVLSGGCNIYPTPKAQIVFYGIAGFPTRWKVTTEDTFGTFVGTRFLSVGAGSEFSYTFIRTLEHMFALVSQVRYIHFFSRSWVPILPCCSTIQPGDLVDILLATTFRLKRELFELGYNPTFFLNQSAKTPATGKVRSPDFVREGAYITYSHIFQRKNPILLGAGFAFSKASLFDARVFTGWLNFTIAF